MNAILLLINLALLGGGPEQTTYQQGTPTPTPIAVTTEAALAYLVGFVVLLVLILVVAGAAVYWLSRKKRSEPQTILAARPDVPAEPIVQRAKPTEAAPVDKAPPRPVKPSQTTPAIFISYRREDTSDVTGRIYDRLCQHFGKDSVFKDVDSIPLGVDFRKHLGNSVGQCNVLLTIIGRQWMAGEKGERRLDDARDYVRIEMEAALKRDIPVVPVLVQGSQIPAVDDLPELLQALAYRNGIPVRPDPDFHQDMDRLIKGIEGHLTTSRQ